MSNIQFQQFFMTNSRKTKSLNSFTPLKIYNSTKYLFFIVYYYET